jgi:protocatechuate 3,4-dioxygenase beta subunit
MSAGSWQDDLKPQSDNQQRRMIRMTEKKVSRREALRLGVGTAAAVATAGMPVLADEATALATPHQTEGPFFPKRDQQDKDFDLTRIVGHTNRASGEVILVKGVVVDEKGKPVSGAVIDVWQANVYGRYNHEDDPNPAPIDPDFQGWGKILTDDNGAYQFKTIMPGAYKVDGSWSRPPHIHFKIAKRGYHEVTTQMYFSGEPLNENDKILQALSVQEQALLVVDFQSANGDGSERAGRFDLLIRTV